jgi:processive 1,2-diacylglycerol beta-glucosyltransferase
MRAAMIYVNAGKGHYVPAKALADSMQKEGHFASVEDLFVICKAPFWEWYCKYEWRFMLHHPRLERINHRLDDTKLSAALIRYFSCHHTHIRKDFLAWYEKTKPDFIVCTNFLGGNILTPIVQELKLDLPVFCYAADAFNNPTAGCNKAIDLLYIPTFIGKELVVAKGQPEEKVKVCPFPLQSEIQQLPFLTKQEARKKLGLQECFTVLLNLGGEGIGNTDFLEEVARRNLNWQIVAVGKLSVTTSLKFSHFLEKYPSFTLLTPGFVNNIGEYIYACDVQSGKAGANALMESLALKRPFLVSNLLYAARDTRSFLQKHKVGWVEDNCKKQVDIVEKYDKNVQEQKEMETHFDNLPIQFDSDAFVHMLFEDVKTFHARKKEL